MAFKPTDEQRAAMEKKGSILVSAAAGSGKTAVLVERVIKMLLDRENPVFANRLLIVTFTNAAAAEMLSRIEARLYEELEKSSEDELVNRQIYLLKSADICTIDSFCIRLVRDNFALCGIEPDFKVTDDNSLYSLRSGVLGEIINGYEENPDEDFRFLLDLAGCRFGEGELLKLIDSVYTDSLKKPFPSAYIASLKAPYFEPFDKNHIWQKYAFSAASETINDAKIAVGRMAEAALYSEAHDKATVYAEVVSNLVSDVEAAVNSGDWDTCFETVHSAGLGKLPAKCGDEMKALKGEISACIDKISRYFSNCEAEVKKDISNTARAVGLLCGIIEIYRERLFTKQKRENVFSFDDVEQLAMSLLVSLDEAGNTVKSGRADELISRYDEVLVDEFQDVNDLQNTLFELLSDNSKKLFIVGDVKQSIYAFRGSNPDIFLKKKDSYGDYLTAGDSKGKKILLSSNFRSRKGICETVNFFFEKIMTSKVGNLVYGEDEMLIPAADYPENGVSDTDFLVIDKVDDDSDDGIVESEAAAISEYIKEVTSSGKILKGENGDLREPDYGDFCILLATLKNKSGIIADILNKNGIPANVIDSGFFDTTEILTALALFHVIDNPQSDVYLARVLMSPLYGFTAEDLAEIRTGRKEMSLFSSLSLYAANSEKAQRFLSEISGIRRMSCLLPISGFVAYTMDKTDMINTFYSLPGGSLRAENLMRFMRLANEYSEGSSGSLFGFLKYVETLPENAVKTSASDDGHSVKIMSIHGSKGLQFPVCIVAGLSHRMNKTDSYNSCLFSSDFGIGFKYYDREKADKSENLAHKILSEENLKRIAQERLRLLYVALTRAEEKLCLVCCLDNAQRTLLRAAAATDMGLGEINANFIKNAQNSADYILAAAILHPDAEILRKTVERKIHISDTKSRISFKFTDAAKQGERENTKIAPITADGKLSLKIRENIGYEYPFAALSSIPAKTSVSMMANRQEAEGFAMSDRPAFMEKSGLSAAGKGTAAHKIMQYIKLDRVPDIDSEIARLLSENRITENEAKAVDRNIIKRFFESDIYRRIAASKDCRREMRFLTEFPVSYYGDTAGRDEKFIVQGAVDLCFAEPDGVVVLDFKTDRVNSPEELKEKYSKQLSIYAVACEKIFSKPVKEKIIYSFSLSKEIPI